MTEIIAALDVENEKEAFDLIDRLSGGLWGFKVGHQLFTAAGRPVVERILAKEAKVFLDLKYHDIPNTVASACVRAADLGVSMLNLHIQGGRNMMAAAVEKTGAFAESRGIPSPLILGVTVLTSLTDDDLSDLGIGMGSAGYVEHLALMGKKAGLDGVVCSPREIDIVKGACGGDFITVTPGIRPSWAAAGDQKRVTTPSEAAAKGSDYLVIGRPVTKADSPEKALHKIREEINSTSSCS